MTKWRVSAFFQSAALQDAIRDWLGPLELPRGVRVGIDIDPYSFV